MILIFSDWFIILSSQQGLKIVTALGFINLLINSLQATTILTEVFLKRNQYVKLLNLLVNLDWIFIKQWNICLNYEKLKRSCIRLLLIWLIEITCLIIPFIPAIIQRSSSQDIWYSSFFIPPYLFCKLNCIYSTLLIILN